MKILPILLIFLAALSRLLPHFANFAPITALALFGAVYLPKKYAFILPLGASILADLVIGFDRTTVFFVYSSFILSGIIGLWVKENKSLKNIVVGTLLASILFFLITNFAVWLNPVSWYSKDFSGLIQSYIAGIPFFRGTILGDLFFTGVLFGGYELVTRVSKKYLPSKILKYI